MLEPKTLARIIKKHRKAAKISQSQLAELAGVHRNYIGLIERAELDPALSYIEKIAKALKIKISKLVEG